MSISLYARLRHRFGPPVDLDARRRFMKVTAAATGAMLLSNSPLVRAQQAGGGKRVVIVGAGFAGLAAAYELKSAGYDVTVIDARERISGRVLSFNDELKQPFIPGRNVEGGGELIGSNHPHWVHYAEKFGLEFSDVSDSELEAPIILDGKRLTEEQSNALWEEMDEVFNRMNDDARKVVAERPWETPDAQRLDQMSVKDWLDAQKDLTPLTRRGVDVQISTDNGVEIAQQSYLGLLASVRGGDVDRYWSESEVYRCKGGNQLLAERLADAIGRDRIILGLAVNQIAARNNGVTITCRDGRTIEADDAIVTATPPTWSKIRFSPNLPAGMTPQMGTNVKWLAHMKRRLWKDLNLSCDSMTDTFLSQTWDSTDAQEGDENAGLACFSGGAAAEKSLAIARGERDAAYKKQLEAIFPGTTENVVANRYMDWPRDPWTMAGYSFPAPGQVTTMGPLMEKGMGRVHFAGEHTCYAFVGYMEGGLTSGTRAARRIASRDGVVIAEVPMPPSPEPVGGASPEVEMKPDANPASQPVLLEPASQPGRITN